MKLLFVCTGNTCRSAMAEAIARDIAQKKGLALEIESAGTYAFDGDDMTLPAKAALREMCISFPIHRARLLTPEMIKEADVIFCMEQRHKDTVLSISDDAGHKTFLLSEKAGAAGDVRDPFGSTPQVYLNCARQLKDYIDVILSLG